MAVELNDSTSNKWNETDASNTASPPDGAPAGMFLNAAEGTWRGVMATVKRAWDRANGKLTVGGTANAITLTPAYLSYPTSYVAGEQYQFTALSTNTGSTTLNINSLGVKNVFKRGSSGVTACTGGEIKAGDNVLISYDGTQFQILSGLAATSTTTSAPTFQTFSSGSGTYTTPANVKWLRVRMVGGGGGGGAQDTNSGTNGGDSSFNSIVAKGGSGGGVVNSAPATGGAGGSGTATLRIAGNPGNIGLDICGSGGSSYMGAGGSSTNGGAGNPAPANSGGGGGAPSSGASNVASPSSGGGAEYVELLITSPASSYAYTVGGKGTGGAAGTLAGGDGGAGFIYVEEHYI